MKRFAFAVLSVLCAMTISCTTGDYLDSDVYSRSGGESMSADGSSEAIPGQGASGAIAGKVTAGEWNDLEHWPFWSSLYALDSFIDQGGSDVNLNYFSKKWTFFPYKRVAVTVTDAQGKPLQGIPVVLEKNGSPHWTACTDNKGQADCWVDMFSAPDQQQGQDVLSVLINGIRQQEAPMVTGMDQDGVLQMNNYQTLSSPVTNQADIAFIVDATGSMSDEIAFLKSDLLDILNRTRQSQSNVSFRTSAVFYRDKGDDYVTRVSNFSTNFDTTINFIKEQSANGGGDYPEAVHTALEVSLQNLSWNNSARTKLAFMLLDAPAHDQQDVKQSLQKSIAKYAEMGIKLIPVSASGVDKSTEFMLRFFAIATGGTYVFITNDSGIGNDHITATVGDYEVEFLNDLIVRLIAKYTE